MQPKLLCFFFLFLMQYALADPPEDSIQGSFVKITIFPNPSPDGIFTVRLTRKAATQPIKLRVFNILGEEILSKEIAAEVLYIETELTLTSFPKGAYMLEITEGNEKQSRRLSYY